MLNNKQNEFWQGVDVMTIYLMLTDRRSKEAKRRTYSKLTNQIKCLNSPTSRIFHAEYAIKDTFTQMSFARNI